MGKSKIIFNGQTLIDLTGDTVTADTLLEGITAHGADGEAILGVMKAGGAEMLSGTFTPTAKTKTVQLGHALDMSGNYALFVNMVGTPGAAIANTSLDSGKYLMRAGSVVSWGGSKQCYAQCNSTTVTKSNTETWTVNTDGSVTLPASYYTAGNASTDMMNFAAYAYQWYFIKG